MIFVNFKTYKEGTGDNAVRLAKILQECQKEIKFSVIPVVQVVDARALAEASGHEVWVQHIDGVGYGQHTGWILPEAVAEVGIKGTFLNHSDHKFQISDNRLSDAINRCQEAGLKTLVFAADISELKLILKLKPTYVAYEPPELIASRDTSVARAKPEIIGEAAKIAKDTGIPLIVGAGVKDSEDVRKSLELEAVGVAVSSAVVLSEDPKKVVLELASGFKR